MGKPDQLELPRTSDVDAPVTRGRAKVQTMTDLVTRERVKRAAAAGNLSEGEVVRRALAIGLHTMGW